jgi:hypothetical protein
MSASPASIGAVIVRYAVQALGGPVFLARLSAVATLSVVEELLSMVGAGLVCDVRRMKESLIRRTEAETAAKVAKVASANAEVQKKLAEAAEAANRANLHKRNDAVARAEKDKLRAEAAKTQAEAEAIRADAESRRIQALAEAQARLIDALAKLRQDGGGLLVDSEQLRQILGLPPPGPPR